jgi:hypothetical protein
MAEKAATENNEKENRRDVHQPSMYKQGGVPVTVARIGDQTELVL